MRKSFVKAACTVVVFTLAATGLSGCQLQSDSIKNRLNTPDNLQIVANYQYILGADSPQVLGSQAQLVSQLQRAIPVGLIPQDVWSYLHTHVITPGQVDKIWGAVKALKLVTARIPAFSDANVQKLVEKQLVQQGKAPQAFDNNTLDFMRLISFRTIAQEAKLSEGQVKEIVKQVQKRQPKQISFAHGMQDNEITNILAEGTQDKFQVPVMIPQVAKGVTLQGYNEARQELINRVKGSQK